MKWTIIPILFLISCTRLEYPIVTRYKFDKPIKQQKIKEVKVKQTKPIRKRLGIDLPIFIVGSIIAYQIMIKE